MSHHRHFFKAFLALSAALSTSTALAAGSSEVILNPPVASSVDAITIRKAFQLEHDPLVSISLKNAQVDVVMRSLAEKAGLSLVFLGDGNSSGTAVATTAAAPSEGEADSAGSTATAAAAPMSRMTTIPYIDLKNVPLSQAFAFVLKLSGLSGRRMYNSLVIATPERLVELGFAAPIVKSYQIYNSIALAGATGAGGAPAAIDEQLKTVLETRGIKPLPKMLMDNRTNTLIVMGTQEVIDIVDAVLPVLDKAVPQVMVEIKLVELSKTGSNQLGVSYGMGQGKAGAGFNSDRGGNAPPFPGTALPGNPAAGSGSTISFNALSDFAPNFNAKLDALIQSSEARVLTNPRIAIRHGIEGTFDAITKVPIISTQTTTTTATQSVTSLSIGETIKITPLIDADHGFITMVITPTISTRGATINLSQGPAPEVNERKVSTTLRVKDGGSVIIGGLMRQSNTIGKNKVPILGDIPLLGALFSVNASSEEEVELVIIVTPHIMKDL